MSFLGFIPANRLQAIYEEPTRQLYLIAEGEIIEATSGIHFNRDEQFTGGLKFNLMGWSGPIVEPPTKKPYRKIQAFKIQLPSPVINSKEVIIADANNPEGKAITIEYAKEPQTFQAENNSEPSIKSSSIKPESVLPGHESITALYKEPFQIKYPSAQATHGSTSLSYDKSYLELIDTRIKQGMVISTFNSKRMGNTQIIATIDGGIAQYVMQETFDVRIIVLEEEANKPTNIPLSYLGAVNIGINLIRQQYPEAELYEVDGTTANGQKTTDPNDINKLKIVCRVNNSTAIIESTSTWGEFGPVQYVDQPWMEDVVIKWPIDMDITEANKLLNKAGYTESYGAVTLRHPLYPGMNQPYYIFSMANGSYIFVGVNDHKVTDGSQEMKQISSHEHQLQEA